MKFNTLENAVALFTLASLVSYAEAAEKGMSVPPDSKIYTRPAIPEDFRPPAAAGALAPFVANMLVVDAVVNNTDPALKNENSVGSGAEISIGVAQRQHEDDEHVGDAEHDGRRGPTIVLTNFVDPWGTSSPLWRSPDRGLTWTKEFTKNPPPGALGVIGCPCDQTVDFTNGQGLAGAFLAHLPDNIFSALSNNLTVTPGAFNYFQSPPGIAVPANHLDGLNNEDQPWLLVGRKPGAKSENRLLVGQKPGPKSENVYVAYDDFNTSPSPNTRVAVAAGSSPLNFTVDNISGTSTKNCPGHGLCINPGHRLAIDSRSGAVYSLFQVLVGRGAGISQNINYMINTSTDGGKTWKTPFLVANADSDQGSEGTTGAPTFCGVNQLLGGVDHATVDPATGDVVVVFGNRDAVGFNRLSLIRLTPNGTGGFFAGLLHDITGPVQAALPSVAITQNRTIGVFYYTCDGTSSSGFPIITAHFSTSTDLGNTFFDNTLESFLSPIKPPQPPRTRILGDYEQVKAVGNTFYGGFAGNRLGFYPLSPFSIIDPIFFKVRTKG
ncbi:MAG: hypothetical protein ACREDD_01975 [Methylocella sp.]